MSTTEFDGPSPATCEEGPPVSAETPRRSPAEVEALGERIARLAAHLQAGTGQLLAMLRAFDASEGWHVQGFTSCARWLSWRIGLSPGAAREQVRVARALGTLPALEGALGRGELSYSACRALTRVATADNEAELLAVARHPPRLRGDASGGRQVSHRIRRERVPGDSPQRKKAGCGVPAAPGPEVRTWDGP